MKQILGFAVLTGPLFLIVLWVPVCLVLAFLVGKKFIKKSLTLKITGGFAVFLIALLLPVSDEIAGRIYFNHLCETEAGVKVYQTIELPAEYWDEGGKPKFLKSNADLDKSVIEGFEAGWAKDIKFAYSSMDESHAVLTDVRNSKILGEVVTYIYWGGWLIRNFSPHNTGQSCGQIQGVDFWRDFYLSVFKPMHIERR
jgi:hypothetical protein